MSINTKSKVKWLLAHKNSIAKKSFILFLAVFLSGNVATMTLYLGFWFGWWSKSIKFKQISKEEEIRCKAAKELATKVKVKPREQLEEELADPRTQA